MDTTWILQRSLRRLAPDQLSLLVELAAHLQPPGDHAGVLALAIELLPGRLRP